MSTQAAIIIILLTLLIGSAIYLVVARFSPKGGRSDRTPTNVYLVTGGAMSLLIAFTMSSTFAQYNSAKQAAQQEADAVMTMSRAATFMAPQLRDSLRDQLVCYANDVITVEWPEMAKGNGGVSPQATATLERLDSTLAENPTDTGLGLSMWQSADNVRLTSHQTRLLVAEDGVPPILMMLLVVGSIITIGSLIVYADRSKPAWGHILVIVGPLFIASAAIVVIMFFDHPYSDAPGSIQPQAMQTVLTHLTHDPIGNLPIPQCPDSNVP